MAAVKVGKEKISLARTGDCFICILRKDGTSWITENQLYWADREDTETIASLMRQFGGDRERMWEVFSPILRESRRRDINQARKGSRPTAYGSLNGQESFVNLLESFEEVPTNEVNSILVFTDGATNLVETRDPLLHAQRIAERYQRGGLHGIVEGARGKPRGESYVDADEATLIGIEFE